jgi:hypothetical protein
LENEFVILENEFVTLENEFVILKMHDYIYGWSAIQTFIFSILYKLWSCDTDMHL